MERNDATLTSWSDFFRIVLQAEDLKKHANRDVQRINAQINALSKSPMSLQRKMRKGRILKHLRANINWALESFYDRNAIRFAINLRRLEEMGVIN